MSKFTVRVELHRADSDDYDVLHGAMETAGFKDTITNNDNIVYQLPPAEYNYVGDANRQQVLSKAKAAANVTGRKSAVLVTESAGRSWDGLEQV